MQIFGRSKLDDTFWLSASAGGSSFAQQGGLIARQNLAIHVSRTTCRAISTNLSLGWLVDWLVGILNKIMFKRNAEKYIRNSRFDQKSPVHPLVLERPLPYSHCSATLHGIPNKTPYSLYGERT